MNRERERDSLYKIQYNVQVSKAGKSLSYEMNKESLIDCPILLIFHVLALYKTPLCHIRKHHHFVFSENCDSDK